MSNRILVTGATGNVGGEIIRQLNRHHADVVAGTNEEPVDGTESIWIDFADKASLVRAMEGISTVFMVLPNHPDMVTWGEKIIDAAKESGVSHIVRSSDSLADTSSPLLVENVFGITDDYLRSSGVGYTITAPCFFMQNFVMFWGEGYRSGTIRQPASEGKIAWVDVRDIAAVNVEALLDPEAYNGQTLIITGPESLSYAEAVEQMNELLGLDSTYVAISEQDLIDALRNLEYSRFDINVMISLNRSIRAGHAAETTDTVEAVTGRPAIRFEQFVDFYRDVWL